MAETILFLTGHLAYESLCRELESLQPREFDYRVHDLGLSVAALMTAEMILRRLDGPMGADRVLVPGLCGGSLAVVEAQWGVPVEKGPRDLKDLPEYFGASGRPRTLDRYDVRIFAEIVDAHHILMGDLASEDQLLLEALEDFGSALLHADGLERHGLVVEEQVGHEVPSSGNRD